LSQARLTLPALAWRRLSHQRAVSAGLALGLVAAVALTPRILGESEAAAMATARRALSAMGLTERAGHRAMELSGGEQQRVALARALVKAPGLLVADEPTAQLDTETARGIMSVIPKAASSGTAVLLATHDRAATELADRVLYMEDGVLTEQLFVG
jgi:ABC-type ATPase involved in cell division